MIYKGVDIYACKFFEVDSNDQLKFIAGKFTGKQVEDFDNIEDILSVFNYCCWIIRKKDMPNVSKFCAADFINDIMPKMKKFQGSMKKIVLLEQEAAKKELKESVKQIGKKYV